MVPRPGTQNAIPTIIPDLIRHCSEYIRIEYSRVVIVRFGIDLLLLV